MDMKFRIDAGVHLNVVYEAAEKLCILLGKPVTVDFPGATVSIWEGSPEDREFLRGSREFDFLKEVEE